MAKRKRKVKKGDIIYFKPHKGWKDIGYLTANKEYTITKLKGSLKQDTAFCAETDNIGSFFSNLDESSHINGHNWIIKRKPKTKRS